MLAVSALAFVESSIRLAGASVAFGSDEIDAAHSCFRGTRDWPTRWIVPLMRLS